MRKKKRQRWSSLSEAEQERLIKFWGAERARQERELKERLTSLAEQGEEYGKELEITKLHEERGKINCACWQCQQEQGIRQEVEKELREEEKPELLECPECGKLVKKLDEENDLCKECVKNYES